MFGARRMMRRRMVARTAVVVSKQLAPHPSPAPPAAEPAFDTIEQLKELGELREQGILSEEEFTAEKKKLLGS